LHLTRHVCLTAALLALTLAGCASTGLNEGRQLIAAGKAEEGLGRLHASMATEPDNI
jgi:general secretion pathway protein D